MIELLEQKCVPCTSSLPTATAEEIDRYKSQVPDWNLITENGELRLQRVYKFPNFKKVTVTWWTLAINGLHHNDFIMAAKSNAVMNKVSN